MAAFEPGGNWEDGEEGWEGDFSCVLKTTFDVWIKWITILKLKETHLKCAECNFFPHEFSIKLLMKRS